ncbi:hypothetical protein ASPWEDRAFT_39587 [Aspergillus wentii DTO 134E9]|uniref:Survival protein SurE-like phosphatase/nucleotidase domain-containing protein n=1 Tax=Aspergillus wentii DTO 134E9 TaxID=1073089 RepID=A0A1L9RSD9_ASPWE|nr:uncharacterized protein ASPWEDRAFT_39587 [Aspergillus wentii DTO 134E9]KAI9930700.1 hypothetical protein MW887_011456 [Aspergillus wentii]OJJ37861.1 hypothetical protein ASPWEDRAFT_39587 [Aspergillus wentii DTO 134E9]
MHILVTNDDGPPCPKSSPFVHSLVKAFQSAGHTVSVILPSEQRSWIGKAHFKDKTLTPTIYRPENSQDEWILIDSTPASCAQIGLHHYFQEKGPVDLVVSGPNLGRNSTALFSLSSGTIGAAMEAALCRKRAIAVSFAHDEYGAGGHDSNAIDEACSHSVRLIQHLNDIWAKDVDVYTVNVPLKVGVSKQRIKYTRMLRNRWISGSAFDVVEQDGEKKFKWAPRLQDLRKTASESGPGNDGWVVDQGMTSVTPLQANYMYLAPPQDEDIILP